MCTIFWGLLTQNDKTLGFLGGIAFGFLIRQHAAKNQLFLTDNNYTY